jgi:hypothetical protein
MIDIFEKPELRLARIAPRPNCASGARGPFRCAQEDYFNIYDL